MTTNLQIHVSNYLPDISTDMSSRHLKIIMVKTQLLIYDLSTHNLLLP